MPTPPDISIWIQKLAEARLPARRSSPDLLQQLQQTLRRPVNRVLVLAMDVDPDIDLLQSVGRDEPENVEAGLNLLHAMLPVRRAIVDARYARRFDSRYPNLDPALLIRRLFRRQARTDALPTDVGVLVVDILTLAQLGQLEKGRPVDDLPVVIDDRLSGKRLRLRANVAATVGDVLAQTSLTSTNAQVWNGPLLRQKKTPLSMPIAATELWLHLLPCTSPRPAAACTRCGECIVACPANIHPAALLDASQRRDRSAGEAFGLRACIECGVCDDVCPSLLPILESIQQLKTLPT